MYKKRIASIIIFFILVMMITSCTKAVKETGSAEEVPTDPVLVVTPTIEVTPTPSLYKCGLTGIDIGDEQTSKLRPIAVMIDNQAGARPQSGLVDADIVYEMPVEGKITRFLAIFHHIETDKIGPVRSARPYFIDKALEFNAVYVHCGGSPQALDDIVGLKVAALNDLNGDPCFWRAVDRKAPHNLYTSTRLMREVMVNKKLENKSAPEYFKFSDDIFDIDGKKTGEVNINYDKKYKVGYKYDESQKSYYRLVNGEKVNDKETGEAITVVNIIFEKVKTKVIDDVGRLELSNLGSGSGYFMTAGKLIEIEWSKNSRQGKTTYKDLKGNEITLNKGNVWIQVLPDYSTVEIKE
jgi:hypothetical protein